MWMSLTLLAILANSLSIVSSGTHADLEQVTLNPTNNVSDTSDTTEESNEDATTAHPMTTHTQETTGSTNSSESSESCRGDSNAMSGCDEECRERCPGYEPVQCKCIKNSCKCKHGFVYDPATYKCILPSQCKTPTTTSTEKSLITQTTTDLNSHQSTTPKTTTKPNEQPSTTLTTKTNEGSEATTHNPKITTEKQFTTTTKSSKDITTHRPELTSEKSICETNSESKTTTEVSIGLTTDKESSTTESSEETDSTTESENTDNTDSLIHMTGDSGWTTETSTVVTTTVGPRDCKGRRERYYPCALSCPQRSCEEFLNGSTCPIASKVSGCKPECRCQNGFFRDSEGNCVTGAECRRAARQTTKSVMSSTTANPNQKTSTTSMAPTTQEPSCEDIGYELFAKGNLEYTAKILNDLVQTKPGNNVLCGGASILYLMAQLAVQAKDNAKKELLKVLNLKETDQMCRCGGRPHLNYLLMGLFKSNIVMEQIRCVLPKIAANLQASSPDIEYDLLCKIYADDSCPLTEYFIRTTTQVFLRGPENVNFRAKDSARYISDDVAQYTNDAFVNFIKPNTLSALSGLILVDAEAFTGKWEKQFEPAFTTMSDFNRNGRIDKIPMMNQRASFLYAESSVLNAKILRLRYTQKEYSLTIFLPNRVDGLNDMLKRMENPETVLSVIESLRSVDVEVYIPKFTISVANRLKNPSIKANIKEIFNKNSTGLSDIASCHNPFVSDILQKVTFQVDELGLGDKKDIDFPDSEEIPDSPSRPRVPQLFKADHAFAYYLFYNKVALIAGVFNR
ncbi:uncharacterized protein LOC110384104 [Helicoverpa armigera]|uniref:uncharacterized protein LOC110384104 n=1 Tax=Helicoverpa armigera TaxID=29058 RepID=UPI0030838F9A